MNTGEKIRGLRLLKHLSQENMAEALKISRVAYSDIERGETDLTESRIKQIADVLEVTPEEIYSFDKRVSYFFENCPNANANVSNGSGSNNNTVNNLDDKELRHRLEKLELENELLRVKHEKAEIETNYYKEMAEKSGTLS